MPYCSVSRSKEADDGSSETTGKGVRIFYQTYGRGNTKILFISGFAGTHESWEPQVEFLIRAGKPEENGVHGQEEDEFEVCCFDNRGMGRSTVPKEKFAYTTTIMARDALSLLDHLGWERAHVFGHSMGSMIAIKLAAMSPHRLSSLSLLNTTGGGFEMVPEINRNTLSIGLRYLAAKTPEQRAVLDLETQYPKQYLDEYVGSSRRREILYQEHVKAMSRTGMQSAYAFEGQLHACWTHKVSPKEIQVIRSSGPLVLFIHGRSDIVAQPCHARRLAKKLCPAVKMVELHGGHLVSHERPDEVNMLLMELIQASRSKVDPQDWSNLQDKRSCCSAPEVPLSFTRSIGSTIQIVGILGFMLFFLGAFMMRFMQTRRVFKTLKSIS